MSEWEAQIDYCRHLGIRPVFLNSHEHVHMFPGLLQPVRRLAARLRIDFVRLPAAEWHGIKGSSGVVRAAAFTLLQLVSGRPHSSEPRLLGVAASGRLDLPHLRARLSRLAPGNYELMCHPGHLDPQAAQHSNLANYHDWQGEFDLLTSEAFAALLREKDIRLTSFADLRERSA
jgi:predicted glycoside hydrolase/deacetylase ChbG (UPF0249 family)